MEFLLREIQGQRSPDSALLFLRARKDVLTIITGLLLLLGVEAEDPFPSLCSSLFLAGLWCKITHDPPIGQALPMDGVEFRAEFTVSNVQIRYWASLVALLIKNLPATWETWVQSLGQEDPLDCIAIHSNILAWRIPMDRGA